MNEILFFTQILLVFALTFTAFKLGKPALVSSVVTLALIANLFVIKQITLFGFQVTASDAFAVGSLLALSLLQEYFGKDEALKSTWICFFFLFFFTLLSIVHIQFIPSNFDISQTAYETILSPTPRLLIASMSVFFIVQQIDVRFLTFLKQVMPKARFALRAFISLGVSQFLDTFLFSLAGLYGIVESIVDVVMISFLIKLTIVSCVTPFFKGAKA